MKECTFVPKLYKKIDLKTQPKLEEINGIYRHFELVNMKKQKDKKNKDQCEKVFGIFKYKQRYSICD